MAEKIKIVDYDPNWAKTFKEESKKIKAVLGKNCLIVHHIGSTAIKGMKARPIIDIMPIVKDISQIAECHEGLEALGYKCKGEFFIKEENDQTYCMQIFADSNKKETGKHLAIREYLRAHEETAKEYNELKSRLGQEFPYDSDGYCEGKEAFMKELEAKAVAWSEKEMQRSNYISMGMCMGLCFGTGIGTSFGNMTMGMCLGLCIGMFVGIVIGNQKIK